MKQFKIFFYDGGHLDSPIDKKNPAYFNLQVTKILPVKVRVIWHFGSGEEVKKIFSRWHCDGQV